MKTAAFLVLFTLGGFAAFAQTLDTAALMKAIEKENFFPSYVVGDDDRGSIGALETIFQDPASKQKFLEVNPNLTRLEVTGTASPFDRYVSISEWLEKYVHVGEYNSPDYQIEYSVSERWDGVTQEFLLIDKGRFRVRMITISRLNNSLIAIRDSRLN